jgi:hypothetical protein
VLATTTFSTAHIGTTAVIIGVLSVPAAYWLLRPRSAVAIGAVCAVAALATFGYRLCANMPQLNNDGVPNFSANDVLAPAVTYILLGIYASVHPPADPIRFAKLRALLTGIALVVNVVTI